MKLGFQRNNSSLACCCGHLQPVILVMLDAWNGSNGVVIDGVVVEAWVCEQVLVASGMHVFAFTTYVDTVINKVPEIAQRRWAEHQSQVLKLRTRLSFFKYHFLIVMQLSDSIAVIVRAAIAARRVRIQLGSTNFAAEAPTFSLGRHAEFEAIFLNAVSLRIEIVAPFVYSTLD